MAKKKQTADEQVEKQAEATTPPAEVEQQAPAGEAEAAETAAAEDKAEDKLPPVQAEVEDIGALRRKLKITVPAERIEARREDAVKQLRTSAQVPGFRIGRAPRRLIEKRFGTEMRTDVKNAMVAYGYEQAVEKTGLKVLGEPEMTTEKLDAIELPENGPLSFEVEVEVAPEFQLPELKGIAVTRRSAAVTDADVEEAIDNWRKNRGKYEQVEGAAQADDLLIADMTFQVEGEEKHEHPNTPVPVRPRALEGIPVEDLGVKLAGTTAGQTVTVEVAVPEAHPKEAWRGKKATFTFAAREVRRLNVPELTEELAKSIGFEGVADMRGWFRSRLELESEQRQKQDMRQQVYDYLLGGVKLELPEGVLGRMKDRVLNRRANELMMQGVPRVEIDKHIDELAVAAGEEAARELKTLFIVQQIAQQLEVQVTEQEVNGLIADMAARYNRRPDSLRDDLIKRGAMEQLFMQILERKAIDRLIDDAKISDEAAAEKAK